MWGLWKASNIANNIPRGEAHFYALAHICEKLAKQDKVNEVLEVLKSIPREFLDALDPSTIIECCKGLIRNGSLEEALRVARNYNSETALCYVAESFSENGQLTKEKELLDSINVKADNRG
jgi:hypothetical protein